MEDNKIVLFKMPQDEYPGKVIKNVMVTYLISKVWACCEQRGRLHARPSRISLVVDEIFQAPTALELLQGQLTQTRKYGLKTILSGHYLKQIEPIVDTLASSDASYMLMKGTIEKDFNALSCNIEGFEYEDLRDMKKFHSLNVVSTSERYYSFITRLAKNM